MGFLQGLVDLLGWDGLTAAEQVTAVYGAGRALFDGRGRR